jgi:DNA-binding PadR family transcriptional regulator
VSLGHILLALLVKPASGYDLKKEFDEGARHYWAADLAQIYPTLKKLEERGFLTSSPAESDKGPPRTVYTRTNAGRDELLAWLRQEPVMGKRRLAYLAQLEHLYEVGDLDTTHHFISVLRKRFVAMHQFLSEVDLGDPGDMNDAQFHELLAVQYGITTLAAQVAWCDASLDRIDKRRTEKETP